jgi:hypothetical protein
MAFVPNAAYQNRHCRQHQLWRQLPAVHWQQHLSISLASMLLHQANVSVVSAKSVGGGWL